MSLGLKAGIGRYVAALLLSGLCVVAARNVKPKYTLKEATDNVNSVAFSPDNHWLASVAYDNVVRLYSSPANSSDRPRLEHTLNVTTTDTAWTVAFSPNAKWMAVGQVGIELYAMDTLSSDTRPVYTLDNKLEQNYVAFSADSKWLATATEDDPNVWLYEMVEAGKPQLSKKLKGGKKNDFLDTVAFSPDGKWLASGSRDRSVYIHSLDSNKTRMWQEPKEVDSVVFSPDSKWLVAGLNDDLGGPSRVAVYAMDQSSNYSFEAAPHDFVATVAFSPDGKWLAVGCGDARVRVYTWKEGSEPKLHCTMVGAEDAITGIAFSPDGQWLAAGTETMHVLLYSEWESIAGTIMV